MTRLIAAFAAVASLLPLVAFFADGGYTTQSMGIIASFTVPATLLGLPLYALLRRRGHLDALHCALGGAALGLAATVPYALSDALLIAFLIPTFATIGAVHGVLFWVLGLWRNPRPNGPQLMPAVSSTPATP
jgi:ABC-type Co2+ transport system permease subunit